MSPLSLLPVICVLMSMFVATCKGLRLSARQFSSSSTFSSQGLRSSMRMMSSISGDSVAVKSAIEAQGVKVRELKAEKAEKESIKAAVAELMALKAQLSEIDGTPVRRHVR